MPTFASKKFRGSSYSTTFPARYRAALERHPFALFGLPFIATIVLGSFFLTPATALRYERHDRKVRQLSKDEELGIGKDKRKIDLRDEYYVSNVWDGQERCVADDAKRNSLVRIWIIGSKSESNVYQESPMESWNERLNEIGKTAN